MQYHFLFDMVTFLNSPIEVSVWGQLNLRTKDVVCVRYFRFDGLPSLHAQRRGQLFGIRTKPGLDITYVKF